ncbi:nicalin-1-like [Populus alba x Populus x berolinensis]|nr:nicalin-1-like [Populus alba x Populus x berolinensis]
MTTTHVTVFCNASGVKVSFFTEFKWPVKNLTHLDHWYMDFLSYVSAPDQLKLLGLSRKLRELACTFNSYTNTQTISRLLCKSAATFDLRIGELEDHTHEVNVQHEVLDGMFTIYDSTKAKLNIYQVASVTFDLLLLLVLGSYLIILFTFLVITTRGLDDLISLFRRPPSRKVKAA